MLHIQNSYPGHLVKMQQRDKKKTPERQGSDIVEEGRRQAFHDNEMYRKHNDVGQTIPTLLP